MDLMEKIKRDVRYINGHGTSTPVGDVVELQAVNNVFKNASSTPVLTSTKSLTDTLKVQPAQEAIYTLIMMNNNFVSGNLNLDQADENKMILIYH